MQVVVVWGEGGLSSGAPFHREPSSSLSRRSLGRRSAGASGAGLLSPLVKEVRQQAASAVCLAGPVGVALLKQPPLAGGLQGDAAEEKGRQGRHQNEERRSSHPPHLAFASGR